MSTDSFRGWVSASRDKDDVSSLHAHGNIKLSSTEYFRLPLRHRQELLGLWIASVSQFMMLQKGQWMGYLPTYKHLDVRSMQNSGSSWVTQLLPADVQYTVVSQLP